MVGHQRGGRRAAVGALLAGVLLIPAACGGGDEGDSDGTIELTIASWGTFGYAELIKEYMEDHPNIKITERIGEYNQNHEQLAQRLAAGGSGTADIEAIDEGYIVQFRSQPENFLNLLDHGAGELKDRWLDWKWEQSLSPDGDYQIGLGTDVGGLATCYRTDLFEEAGLPTDREEVTALWPTWDAFLGVGRQFEESGTDAKFLDAASGLFNTVLSQQERNYYADDGSFLGVENSPGVKVGWDVVMEAIESDITAKLATSSEPWVTAMREDAFAVVLCPAWMIGQIQQNAPDTEGKWDVAGVPGTGGGNWGGSFLTIPKNSPHPQEAYDLAVWLTAPDQQLQIFQETGNLPSQPALYEDPALTGFTNDFMGGAPVGQIFTGAAENLRPQFLGEKNGPIRQEVENAIREVENGNLSPDDAWERAVTNGNNAAS